MNNEQNNIIGGINPIPPTPNPNSSIEPMNQGNMVSIENPQAINNNVIPGSSAKPIGVVTESPEITASKSVITNSQPSNSIPLDSIPITPVPGAVLESNANNNMSNSTEGQILSINSNSVVPEMTSNANKLSASGPTQNLNAPVPELKIDSVSPFDIGIGGSTTEPIQNVATISSKPDIPNNQITNVETAPTTTMSNNTPLTNEVLSDQTSSSGDHVVSVGKYLGNMILFAIPIIGFIMLLVKAFDKKDKNISNFAKAYLLLTVILGIIFIVATIYLNSFPS